VIRPIALIALALAASAAPSQEPPPSVEAIAARYFQGDTFCEAGTRGSRVEPRENFSPMTFAGCASRGSTVTSVPIRPALPFRVGRRHAQRKHYD
jgi:hypothetical protein